MRILKQIFDFQTKSLNFAAFILSFFSFLSLILGLIRDRLLAGKFGLGDELDIYYAAFKIPDFLSAALILGTIGAAIIPIFSERLVKSKKLAFDYLSNFLNLFLFFLLSSCFFLFILIPYLIPLVAPGFSLEKREITVSLARIMLLSPIFLGLGNLLSAILRVFQRFLVSALAPLMYNLGIIIGILFFFPKFGLEGLAWGVVLGGFLHFLIQFPFLKKLGFQFKKVFNFWDPYFLKTIKLTIPRSLGLASSQLNLIVVTALASTFPSGSISALNLAESLSRPLLTLIGVSFSTAVFPSLSLSFSQKKFEKFRKVFSFAFSKILFFSLFFAAFLFLFRNFLVNLILKVGKFGLLDSYLTAACLGMFSLGIFAQGLNLLIAKSFYALQDTKTPAFGSILGFFLNVIFCFLFIHFLSFSNFFSNFISQFLNFYQTENLPVIGLPLALSLSGFFQFLFLFLLFLRNAKIKISEQSRIK